MDIKWMNKNYVFSEKEKEVLLKQRNLNYIIQTYVFKHKKKVFIHLSAVQFIEMYAMKQNVEPLNNCENIDSYPKIFKEVLKLKFIRHVGKKSSWLPGEGMVLTKKGEKWRSENLTKGDYNG